MMPNATMNVSLPEALEDYVQERVAQGAFSDPSDYIRTLIREDRKRQAEERLEALLLEGLDSGDTAPLDAAEWERIRQEVRERIGAKRHPA
jgi:antitoxin ParD1/3/4